MTKAEKAIIRHISGQNGLTNPNIAANSTGYSIGICRRCFAKYAIEIDGYNNQYFFENFGQTDLTKSEMKTRCRMFASSANLTFKRVSTTSNGIPRYMYVERKTGKPQRSNLLLGNALKIAFIGSLNQCEC